MNRSKPSKINPIIKSKDKILFYMDFIFDQIFFLIDIPESSLYQIINRFGIVADTVHALTNELAEDVRLTEIIPTAEAIEQVVDAIAEGKHRRPVFVFAADGAMAPIRSGITRTPNCWREVRGIRGYLLDDDHIVHLLSWHQISSKQEFLGFLHDISANNLIPRDMVRLCFVGDGAQWIWDCVQEVFPECRQVLDYCHCAEHLHAFANAHFGPGKGKEWIEATKARLFDNSAIHVIAGLKRLKCVTDEARKNRDSLVNYLSNHKYRIDYGRLRRGGYPSGSGAIESANNFHLSCSPQAFLRLVEGRLC